MNVFSTFSIYKGLPRSIYILFFAQTVNSLGMFVYPFLTMFLTQRLGFPEGKAGLFIALSGLAMVPGSLIGGKLVDKIGRKKIYVIAQLAAAAWFIPCAFLGDSVVVAYFIIAGDFFNGLVRPTHSAMATDLTRPENRQAAFSFLYLGHNLGFSIGPVVAGFLFNHHIRFLFIGDSATTILSVLLVLIFVPETMPAKEEIENRFEDDSGEQAEKGGLLKALLTRPFLLIFILLMTLLNFVYAQMTFSLPLFAVELFGDRGPVFFGTLMTENAVLVITLTAFIIAMTKKNRPMRNVAIAGFLYAVGFGMLFFVNRMVFFYLSVFVWTIGEIISVTNSEVYIANHTPISHRGRFNSILPLFMQAGWAVSPPLIGAFIQHTNVRLVWLLSFGLSLLAVTGMMFLHTVEKRRYPERFDKSLAD
jgi:MFS family permease